MTEQDLISKLMENLTLKGDKIIHEGIPYTKTTFQKTVCTRAYLFQSGALEYASLPDQELKTKTNTLVEKVFKELRKKRFNGMESPDAKETFTADVDRSTLIPLVNLKEYEMLFYSPGTDTILDFDEKSVRLGMDSDSIAHLLSHKKDCIFEYDPYNIARFAKINYRGVEVNRVNMYSPPKWRMLPDPENEAMPEIVEEFLSHVFPKEESLEYFLSWAKEAIIGRNETYLVLNGAKGLGKGIICDMLGSLVGQNNYTFVPVGYADSQFNSFMQDTRIVVYDEFKVDKESHTRLKRYINSTQNIEAKGKNAVTKEVYCSSIITNNDESDMHLECDDRRFSVLDLGTKNLNTIWTQEKINDFAESIKNETSDLVVELGYFLLNYCPDEPYNKTMPYRGDKYFRLVYQTLAEWQKFLVELATSRTKEIYEYVEISSSYGRAKLSTYGFPKTFRKINDFIMNYFDKDGLRIAEWQGRLEDGDLVLVPAPQYKPKDTVGKKVSNQLLFGNEEL